MNQAMQIQAGAVTSAAARGSGGAARAAPHRRARRCVIAVAVLVLGGCSAEQVYGSGQAWQRHQCERLADTEQRDRCIAGTDLTYPQYQTQRRSAVGAP